MSNKDVINGRPSQCGVNRAEDPQDTDDQDG